MQSIGSASSPGAGVPAGGGARFDDFGPAVFAPVPSFSRAMVKLTNVQRSFQVEHTVAPALRHVSVGFPAGRLSAVVGPQACGKSTLLAVIAGAEAVNSGHVHVENRPISALSRADIDSLRGRSIGFVTRRDHLVPTLSVEKNLTFYADVFETQFNQRRLDSLVKAFRLENLLQATPAELSLQQRFYVLVIREMLLNPPLMLIDDPGADAQSPAVKHLMRFLQYDNTHSHRTIIFTTSNPAVAANATDVFFMSLGDVVAYMHSPTVEAVTQGCAQLENFDPSVAFAPVKNKMTPAQVSRYFKPSGVWPEGKHSLRERLHVTRNIVVVDPQEAEDLTPPPGLENLTGKPAKGNDLAGQMGLLSALLAAQTGQTAVQTGPSASQPGHAPTQPGHAPTKPVPTAAQPEQTATHTGQGGQEPPSENKNTPAQGAADFDGVDEQIHRMEERLKEMAHKAQERLDTMENRGDNAQRITPPQPRHHGKSETYRRFEQENNKQWDRLISVFGRQADGTVAESSLYDRDENDAAGGAAAFGGPGAGSAQETAWAAGHGAKPGETGAGAGLRGAEAGAHGTGLHGAGPHAHAAQPGQTDQQGASGLAKDSQQRRAQLIEMMQKAQKLLAESEGQLKEARAELQGPTSGKQ